jgi:hypothetical protein
MSSRRRWKWYLIPAALIGAPIFLALFIAVGGGIVMLLWNWLLPSIFGWPPITIWQGFGLLALCRILFGGFGRGCGRSRDMTPEDRERFRQRMRERFCRPSVEGGE